MKDAATLTSHDRTTRHAAYAFIVIFALTEAALIFARINTENLDLLKEMIVTLRDTIIFIVGYLFGSSMGSRAKDKLAVEPEAEKAPLP